MKQYLYKKIGNFLLYPNMPRLSKNIGIEESYECAKIADH
jgi:hypothetical protein